MTILITAVMDLEPSVAERILLGARPLIEASLAEPGCEAYSWALDPLTPGRIHVFERWTDEASLAHHFTLPNYTEMRTHLRSAGPIKSTSRKYRVAHDEPVYDETGTPRADFFTLPA
ncbi:putative quinol monooxygenase [Sphingomonas jatrophae]|uniref:Quinol monooxygenase YgiN n=1 Tax=Sphingomonas jatrophae TaxID=1166337 RepID=A0A1I6M4A2_9SPHN|nr:putative quinol monooxygenase [Sphingomonas jatrophae]SFS10501.1 Quinol monooxygenase YgiN [Sphingomonas jatrophae]